MLISKKIKLEVNPQDDAVTLDFMQMSTFKKTGNREQARNRNLLGFNHSF